MTDYLLDTNVLSAFAPKKDPSRAIGPELASWVRHNSESLFFSTVTAVEIEAGLIKLERISPGAWQQQLVHWYALILEHYKSRIVALDLQIARLASALTDQAKAAGNYPGFADTAIAATAACKNMTLLTRNVRHFEPLGISVADPFERLPP